MHEPHGVYETADFYPPSQTALMPRTLTTNAGDLREANEMFV